MHLPDEIRRKAEYWALCSAFDATTQQEIQSLLQNNLVQELTDRFYTDLAFGTGGMRGIMGAGTCRMNTYNIRKASTALALQLLAAHASPQEQEQKISVAIAYDSRHNSREFAHAAAEVLAAHGIRVLMTAEMRPVPLLSFMVRHWHCQAGICVTASHNPPEYNGFKVYGATGGQVTPPQDLAIIEQYQKIAGYENFQVLPFASGLAQGQIRHIGTELDTAYFAELKKWALWSQDELADIAIVYSPLHGTGIYVVPKALQLFGFTRLSIPASQKEPDGNFPTVSSPNPENPEALSLAIEMAKAQQADLVLATDPDSDRIACVVREQDDYVIFNGNQLCCLLTEFVLSSLQAKGLMPENPLVISTVVTTKLHREIAAYHGAHCELTLTGFKWICRLIDDYESGAKTPYRHFVCGGEESYGFLAGSFVRDKDAVSACALTAAMVAFYKKQGKTLTNVLDALFLRHHVYAEALHNLVLPGQAGAVKIAALMEGLRQNPPRQIAGLQVIQVSDLLSGSLKTWQNQQWQNQAPSELPASNVLLLELADGSHISLRPSGTEPKIKAYFSARVDPKAQPASSLQELKTAAATKLSKIQDEFLLYLQKKDG